MDAWRYGIYLLVFTFDISLVKFHISTRPCIILYIILTHRAARVTEILEYIEIATLFFDLINN